MRIAISALSVKPGQTGGGETVLRNLAHYLPLADPEIEYLLFVTRENRELFAVCAANLSLEVAPDWIDSPARRVAYEIFTLPKIVRRRQVDLFLAINQVFSPLLRCSVMAFVQNLLYYHYREFYRFSVLGLRAWLGMEARNLYFALLNGLAIRRAAHIIAVSEIARREISCREGVALEKITTVPLAVSTEIDPQRVGEPVDVNQMWNQIPESFFLMVGALEPYKNIDRVIAALAQLRQECDTGEVYLVLLGLNAHGYDAYLRRFAAQMGVADAVCFLGTVPHKALGSWYRKAKALMLLSACEAFPLPPLEAMAWGTPVIASNLSSMPEVLGEGGVLVDPCDTNQVAGAMYRILVDCNFREELAERGYRWVRHYSWEQTAARMTKLFRAQVQ